MEGTGTQQQIICRLGEGNRNPTAVFYRKRSPILLILETARLPKNTMNPFADCIREIETATKTINTPKELARRMASLGQLIREAIKGAMLHPQDFANASPEKGGTLNDQLELFRKVLIKDLTKNQFADMYAQTICYGLFVARCNCENPSNFSRWNAARDLPKTNPFLRSIFGQIAGPDLDFRIAWAVDELAEMLKHTEIESILKDFGKRTRQEDPVVHFYETFLAEYDPEMRESRGVYYTPEPVVNYLVKSVDYLLKDKFKIAKGLADSSKIEIPNLNGEGTREIYRVLILDPAVGTGAFIYGLINYIYESLKKKMNFCPFMSANIYYPVCLVLNC